MTKVTEYYTQSCPLCTALKQRLSKTEGIEVEFIDLMESNPMGCTQAPWVIIRMGRSSSTTILRQSGRY